MTASSLPYLGVGRGREDDDGGGGGGLAFDLQHQYSRDSRISCEVKSTLMTLWPL